jgi:DNA-directed RNA polymerase
MIFKKIVTATKLIRSSKPVTISLPTDKLNKMRIKRSFMPNLIHSLDAANIHLLIKTIIKKDNIHSLYTIHDCFATTPNNMAKLEKLIKICFIQIYFTEENYLVKMHNSFLEQIQSFGADIRTCERTGSHYIKDEKGFLKIPNIPPQFISNRLRKEFIDGIIQSIYFIK